MERIYMVSEKELRTASLINENVDSAFLQRSILDAQEINLQQIIGSKLYNSLKKQIKDGVFKDPKYQILLDEYINPYLINQTMATISIPLQYKFRNAGIVTNNDMHYNSVRLDEVTYVERHYENLASFNANRMTDFIIENKTIFTEIDECSPIMLKRRTTAFPISFRK